MLGRMKVHSLYIPLSSISNITFKRFDVESNLLRCVSSLALGGGSVCIARTGEGGTGELFRRFIEWLRSDII